jgi:hypothetical protein
MVVDGSATGFGEYTPDYAIFGHFSFWRAAMLSNVRRYDPVPNLYRCCQHWRVRPQYATGSASGTSHLYCGS